MAIPADVETGDTFEEWRIKTNAIKDELSKNNLVAVTDPGITDDSGSGYSVNSIWLNTAGPTIYRCTDASVGAAVWLQSASTSSPDEAAVAMAIALGG